MAFRRPTHASEIAPLLALFNDLMKCGESFEAAMQAAYVAALCSPDFLCLKESTGNLNGVELASRLSYAFWNTLPDSQLLELGTSGKLLEAETLRTQVDRLLGDDRSSRFVVILSGTR